ncbi:MAG: hypothetical protein A3D74_04190 [Candidatus Levybacteria bacterium RIFCSPHIGHO2_02_FULL_37_13]|nr:MAG: hypothetical protein A3D74_04190 [Candidatus Levybacteria bacterium RIFCSPHIGHO2_02_FULL_37_13]OGH30480.1 MAG: hypothetical protein A3E40_05205 [Candidatus Levybacteria bacterium RIFCSPHIGHO2_12_FULL_37_9]
MKKSVSIGIPAYNEEENIKILLSSVLAQKQDNFIIKEIVVVSDGSTDETGNRVLEIRNKIIKLFKNNQRIGQVLTQNIIVKKLTGDIFVLLNGDIVINDSLFIQKLIEPILNDEKVGIVSPAIIPISAGNLFEKIINFSVDFKTRMYESWNHGNNIYLCHGRARAFSREFIKDFVWKGVLSEDAYSYLLCIKRGFKFVYQPKTQVYYRSPANFSEHKTQSSRFLNSISEFLPYFQKQFLKREFGIPAPIILKNIALSLLNSPFYLIAYTVIFLVIKAYPYKNIDLTYEVSSASRRLKLSGVL